MLNLPKITPQFVCQRYSSWYDTKHHQNLLVQFTHSSGYNKWVADMLRSTGGNTSIYAFFHSRTQDQLRNILKLMN